MVDKIISAAAGSLVGFIAYGWWAEDILPPNMMLLGLIVCLVGGAIIGILINKRFGFSSGVPDSDYYR